jgi:hypothetical protein
VRVPFTKGKHRQTPAEVRAENQRLTTERAEANTLLNEASGVICGLIEERDWFHDRWIEVGEHAAEAEIVVGCLTKELEVERRKVGDLEAIAGPWTPSEDAPTPCFTEAAAEHPLPDFTTSPAPIEAGPDTETTVQTPIVLPLADALTGAS